MLIKPDASIASTGETYAQWVRLVTRRLSEGPDGVISLFDSSVAEPVELLRQVIEDGFRSPVTTRYTSVFSGNNPFIVDALSARYGVAREKVLCTTGATGAISLLYRALLKRGDHIVVENPGFDIFANIAASLGVVASAFERPAPNYEVDVSAIEASLRPNTQLVILSNLHNPSGALVQDEILEDLAKLAARRKIKIIVDEVYLDYVGEPSRRNLACKLHPNMISVSSLTKNYGLSALRCGWIIAEPNTLRRVKNINDKFEFGVSKLAHAVAALVLENASQFDRYASNAVAAARPVMEEYFQFMLAEGLIGGGLPEHGCICFPRLIGVDDTRRFSDWLAGEHGVIVAPGEYFGAPGHVRLGFALAPAALRQGLARFCDGLRAYNKLQNVKTSAG